MLHNIITGHHDDIDNNNIVHYVKLIWKKKFQVKQWRIIHIWSSCSFDRDMRK